MDLRVFLMADRLDATDRVAGGHRELAVFSRSSSSIFHSGTPAVRQDLAFSSATTSRHLASANIRCHETGEDALGFSSPPKRHAVRRIFKINRVQIVRQLLGVTAFSCAGASRCISCSTSSASRSRPAITATSGLTSETEIHLRGMTAFTILTMPAITSTLAGSLTQEALGDAADGCMSRLPASSLSGRNRHPER
jgi:hypothetical protein